MWESWDTKRGKSMFGLGVEAGAGQCAGGSHYSFRKEDLRTEVQTNTRSGRPVGAITCVAFAEVGELLSFEVGKLYLSSHKEADDLGFRLGARAHPATHARSPYLAAKPAIKFFTGVEKHLHRLHRLACPARLHASQTEVGRFFDRSNTGSYFYSGIYLGCCSCKQKAKFRTLV
jgi:hypothetical protein